MSVDESGPVFPGDEVLEEVQEWAREKYGTSLLADIRFNSRRRSGLTKREFAAIVIASHMANNFVASPDPFSGVAEEAVKLADAVLKELSK